MKIKKILASLLIAAMLLSSSAVNVVALAEPIKSASDYVLQMQYNKRDILTREGEKVVNFIPRQGRMNNNDFTVVTRTLKSINNNKADISVINSAASRVYPGALVRGDEGLLNNMPTIVNFNRKPVRLSVNLPGMIGGSNSVVVDNPNDSTVQSAINDLLQEWNAGASAEYKNISANMQYTETMAYSKQQVEAAFGIDYDAMNLGIDFSAVASGEKQVKVANFKQIYYTVKMDTPKGPQAVFKDDVTEYDLSSRDINSDNPLLYVSQVAYGRSIYVAMETTSKSTKVDEAFNALIEGVDVSQNAEYQEIIINSTFYSVIIGGSARHGAEVISGKLDALMEVIQKGSNYNVNNPGAPISYTVCFLKDNSVAVINNFTEYVETKVTKYTGGELRLRHTGGYVLQYYISWDEVSYDKDGNQVLTHKEWEKNGWDLTSGFYSVIPLGGNVRNLNVRMQECTGLFWEWWRTIYHYNDLPIVKVRTISNWGTTLIPKVSDVINN